MARGAQSVPRAGLTPGTAGSVISGLGWAGLASLDGSSFFLKGSSVTAQAGRETDPKRA